MASQPEPDGLEVSLVPLRRRHLRAVLHIEAQVYPRPWSLPLFMSELNLRSTRHYVAARVQGQVVGYAGLMFAAGEGHITNIAVDPAWHRHQIGSRLLVHQARIAIGHQAQHLTLEVRVSNQAAQAMYRRFGFVTAGVRKNYYSETNEDALVMWAYDIGTDEYRRRLDAIEADIRGLTLDEAGDGRPPGNA